MAETKGKLVIVSGPSGVGKSTISRELVRRLGAHLSVSATTRTPGCGEKEGVDYHFLSQEEFKQKMQAGEFIEYAEVFGNYYGTPKAAVDEALAQGKIVLLEIDVQGGRQVKRQYPDAIMVFILPPDPSQLAQRMSGRGRGEDEAAAKRRLNEAGREIAAAWQYYEHMVINDDLEDAIQEVIDVIQPGEDAGAKND